MADVRNENRSGSSPRSDVERPRRTEQEAPKNDSMARRQPGGGLGLPRDPFSSMNVLRREMDRLFENFGFASAEPATRPAHRNQMRRIGGRRAGLRPPHAVL